MDLAIRAFVGFIVIFGLTRIVGRRELSTLEPFDLILLVVIGDLVQQGITQSDESITGLVIVVAVIGLMTVALAYANFRFSRLRAVLEGGVVVLIEDGSVIQKNLKRERLTIEEVEAEARLQQIEKLDDVRLAVLETSGQISFIQA